MENKIIEESLVYEDKDNGGLFWIDDGDGEIAQYYQKKDFGMPIRFVRG